MRIPIAALALALVCFNPSVVAKGGGHSYHAPSASSHSSAHSGKSHSFTGSHSKAAPWVHLDAHGKIARDPRQTNAFKRPHPCPSTSKSSGSCPGYVIDHVTPLKRGGSGSPSNMQWQTKEAAKQSGKRE